MLRFMTKKLCLMLPVAGVLALSGCSGMQATQYISGNHDFDQYEKDQADCDVAGRNAMHTTYVYAATPAAALGAGIAQGIIEGNQYKKAYSDCMTAKSYAAEPITNAEAEALADANDSGQNARKAAVKKVYEAHAAAAKSKPPVVATPVAAIAASEAASSSASSDLATASSSASASDSSSVSASAEASASVTTKP